MKTDPQKREELARLTRYANQLAADLADTRLRIRTMLTDLGMPNIAVLKPFPAPVVLKDIEFGPRISVGEALPETWRSVRIHLPNQSTALAVWTGREWWAQGMRQNPTHWQSLAPEEPADRGAEKKLVKTAFA
jgi:hypothetical protein